MKEIGQLPEFDVIRLLEAAHRQLQEANTHEREHAAVQAALSAVDRVLEAKHRSSTVDAVDLSKQLRDAARILVPIESGHAQKAMMDMMAAADMGC